MKMYIYRGKIQQTTELQHIKKSQNLDFKLTFRVEM